VKKNKDKETTDLKIIFLETFDMLTTIFDV